jgi:leucyl aminopeptidase
MIHIQAIALALLVRESGLRVKLRLLLPIAENAINGNALRPGDVIRARNGKTTEITNTDAEGRLILADALSAATENPAKRPDLVVDFATLTGAARVALGSELPALFSNNLVNRV